MGLPKTLQMLCTLTHYYHVSQNQLGLPRKLPHLLTTSFVMVILMITGSSLDYFIPIYQIIFQFFILIMIPKPNKMKPFSLKESTHKKTWKGLQRHYVTRTGLLYYPVKIPRGPIPCSLTNSRRYTKNVSHWSHINLGIKHGNLGWQRVLRTRLTEKTNCIFVNRRPITQSMRGYIKIQEQAQ